MEIDEEKNIASDIKTMAEKKDVEKDSGIEESLGNSPDSETLQQKEDSDSDEDFCVRSHQRQSRIIDDDDDDEEDNNRLIMDFVPEAAAPKDDAPFVLVAEEEEESEDEDSLFIIKRKKKNSQNSSKSLQDTGDDFSRKDLLLDSDIFDAKGTDSDSDSPPKGNGDSDSDTPFKRGFDSKSNSPSKDVNTDDNQSDEKETDDEGINTDNLSAKLKSLLKKGASKKPKKLKARASKTIAEEKLQLHSETQRIIRESKVLIPYHQPESKSVDDFLNRAMRKQQQYRALKVKCLDERKKVEFVQDTITHDSTLFKRASLESATQNSQTPSSSQVADNPDTQSQSEAVEPLNSINGDAAIVIGDSEAASNGLLTENSCPEGESKDLEKSSLKIDKNDDDDELPDLIISEEPACEVDSTQEKNVVDLELFQEVPKSHAVEESSEDALEKDMEVDNPSEWVVDENGLLKTDDPLMDQLVASDFKGENVQETHGEASLDVVQEQMETEQLNKTEENDKKLSVSELLSPELKNMKPKLSGSWDQPIFFDEEQNKESKETAGLDKLMQRFFEHAKCPKEQKTSKVNIKIVQKEKTSENKEELTLNTITYQSEEPEELKLKSDKPGAKLLLLKDKLQQQMRVKRESARQKRCEIFNLDNEDGYQAEEEEEEAELTDGSDTDVSEDDLIENDLGEDYGKEKRLHNAFVDEEAEEDEDEDENEEDDENEDDDADDDDDKASDEDAEDDDVEGEKKSNLLSKEKQNNDKKVEVLFDASLHSQDNSDSDSIIPESQQRVRIRKIVKNLILSDEESQDVSTQYKDEKSADDPFQKTDFSGTFASTNNNVELKTPSAAPFIRPLSMPIEDSQDLYKSSSDFQSPEMICHNMSFPLEFQASPMFDDQGFLRVKTLTKTVNQPKISALSELCDENDENTDDILGLCSGRFTGTQDNRLKSCRNLFSDSQSESQFPASGSFPLISCDSEKKSNEADEETEEFPSLKLVSDDEEDEDDTRKRDSSSENNENDDSEAEGISDDEEKEDRRQVFRNFKTKSSGKIRREFVDEEAELSGSEYDSDEDDNLNDEYDIMEEEEGDNDVNLTEEQLRNQVGRVHLKNMMDEDKREVMRLQEMYLPDGDLFSEGNGRMRRFRWKNLDDNSQQDMFNTESETEEKEEEEPDELKWRIERYEREKWLKEQEVNEKKTEEESSFLKFGRIFLKKKGMSIPDPTKKVTPNEKEPLKQNKMNIIQTFKKGSFLSRSNDTLAKIAEMTKPVSNQTVTAKTNGRNFVFSVVTPDDTETPKATGLQKTKSESKSCQPAKKRKIEPVKRTLSEASIFRHIDKSFS